MASTIEAEVRRLLRLALVSDPEIEVQSCNAGDPNRVDDDTCVLTITDASSPDAASARKEIRVDDVFSLINTWNLSRGNGATIDPRNYFFRLDANAAFFRRGSASSSDFADGALLYRAPGNFEWRRLEFKDIQSSPELRAAIIPILMRTVSSRDGYARLNGSPHHQDDDAYAQAKAVLWLINLTPRGDVALRDLLIQTFPAMNADGARAAFLRLREEGTSATRRLIPILVGLMGDPSKRDMANAMLAEIAPGISPEDRSSRTVVKPSFAWELAGSVAIPWSGALVGTYTAANAGVQTCIDRAYSCDQGEGFRIGASGEAGRMTNGYGYVFFGGRLFAGNENLMGFLDGGANWYPTGGPSGDLSVTPAMGGGVKVVPVSSFPLGLKVGVRINPQSLRDGALHVGLGIGQ